MGVGGSREARKVETSFTWYHSLETEPRCSGAARCGNVPRMIAMITDEEVKRNIAANVTRLRGERTRYALAKEAGMKTAHIIRIESGHYMPGAAVLARVAHALGTTMDALLLRPPLRRKNSSRG